MKARTGDKLLITTPHGTMVGEYLYPLASSEGPSEYRHKIYIAERKRVLTLHTDGIKDPVVMPDDADKYTVAAQDAPVGVALWSCPGQAGFVTLEEVQIIRSFKGTKVKWVYVTGDERIFDVDEQVVINLLM